MLLLLVFSPYFFSATLKLCIQNDTEVSNSTWKKTTLIHIYTLHTQLHMLTASITWLYFGCWRVVDNIHLLTIFVRYCCCRRRRRCFWLSLLSKDTETPEKTDFVFQPKIHMRCSARFDNFTVTNFSLMKKNEKTLHSHAHYYIVHQAHYTVTSPWPITHQKNNRWNRKKIY